MNCATALSRALWLLLVITVFGLPAAARAQDAEPSEDRSAEPVEGEPPNVVSPPDGEPADPVADPPADRAADRASDSAAEVVEPAPPDDALELTAPDAGPSDEPAAELAGDPDRATARVIARPAELDVEPEPQTSHPPGELDLMDVHIAENVRFRPGRGLSIASDDGLFSLTTRVRVQILYALTDEPGADLGHELTLRRARLAFTGNFFGEDNRFKFELALSPRDEGISDVFDSDGPERTPLLDYYLEFRQLRELNLRVGQYKVPFSRQRLISSGNLQMVDRSIVNSEFNLDRDVGLDLRSRDLFGLGLFRYYLGVYIGQGRDAVGADDFGLMYIGRFEFLPFGMFDDYQEADFARTEQARLSIGVGAAAIDRAHGSRGIRGRRPADGGTTNTQHFTADLVFMYGGFSFMSEFILRTGQRNPGGAVDEFGVPIPVQPASEGWGLMAQAGFLLPDLPIELAARYGTNQPLGDTSPLSPRSELGLSLSYYVARHPFKVQLDAFRLFGDRFDVGETRIRLQVQASL